MKIANCKLKIGGTCHPQFSFFNFHFSISNRLAWIGAFLLALLCGLPRELAAQDPPPAAPAKRILAHYMPWYEAKPISAVWGWHWTMNFFDPEKTSGGRPQIASHFRPKIGPYDSSDPHVLEYHLLQMKLAGIDGVIVDWYGLQDFRDYAILHRNTQRLIEQAERLGLSFAICYEDQTVAALVEAGRIARGDRVRHVTAELDWIAERWFPLKGYLKIGDRPVLLSFGRDGLNDAEWTECLKLAKLKALYFSEHQRRTAAAGAFDWPVPKEGIAAIERFEKDSQDWPHSIATAYPRFVDIYAEAKVHPSWGRIEDGKGSTFRKTLERALTGRSELIQIATWNDWGEGTQIEPSAEIGYRDLEGVQELRRKHMQTDFAPQKLDLRLAHRLFHLRLRSGAAVLPIGTLDEISRQLATGQIAAARVAIEALETGKLAP